MTKLEELARAYADAWKADIEAHIPDHGKVPSWEEMGPGQRAAMMRVTRAVVENALREPNEAVIRAMFDHVLRGDAGNAWIAAVDAILKEDAKCKSPDL